MNIHYTKKMQFWRSLALVWLLVCGFAPFIGHAQQFTIGTGTASNASTGTVASPFANWWEGSRQQYLYRSAELQAAGMASGMIVTDIAFNVVNNNAALPHQNFKIWIGNTTNTALGTWVTTGLTQVHGPVTVTPGPTGWVNFSFSSSFVWTGDNIVVQVLFNNNTNTGSDFGTEWNQNISVQWTTALPANTTRVNSGDGLTETDLLNNATVGTGGTSRPNARFTAIPPTPCSGAVTGGTAVASPVNFCNSQSTSLSVTGGTGLATGLTYQWQQLINGVWTDIVGATSASLAVSPTVSVTTQFRRKITCTNSGAEDFSVPATFTNVGGSTPYASLPYIQDFENWVDACFPKDLPGINWRNTPVASPISSHNPNLSWRRQDQGSTAPGGTGTGWTNANNNLTNGNMIPISGNGAACFHMGGFPINVLTGFGQQGWMDLYVNMGSVHKKEVRFLYRNRQQFVYVPPVPGADRQWMPVHGDQMEVLLSTDGGLTFPTTLGVFGSETPDSIPPAPVPSAPASSIVRNNWKKIAIKVGDIAPTSVIRFRATTSSILPPFFFPTGAVQTDIGIDDVQVVELKPCDGTPIAGTIFGNPRLCEPGTVYFSVTGSADLLGGQDYSFQWETSTDGVTWTPVTGATLPDYTTPLLSTEPYYRRRITCANGGAVNYTPAVQVKQVRPLYAPVTPGLGGRYIQLFNSWIDGCQDKQFPDQHWKNTPTLGNRSWRNTADVSSNVGKWFIGFAAPANSITAQEGTGAAAFFSRGAVGAGDLDLHVNLSASSNRKAVQLYYSNAGGTDNVGVALSTNGGTSFGANILTLRGPTNPAWAKSGAFITSNSATAVLRFKGQSGGPPLETNDQGLDSLVVIDLVPCSTTPIGGEASASPANFCMASEIAISVQKGSDDPAWARDDLHTFQWQVSTDNGVTWTDITGATGGTYTLTAEPQPQVPPKQYRRKIICPNGNLEAFSTVVTLEFPYTVSYAKIPYYNGFETTWATGGAGPTCSGGNTPAQAAIRPTSPTVNTTTTPSIFNDAANIAVPARNQHWRSTGANNASTWRRTPPAPTGWTTTGNWNSYARNFPIETASASFNGFGGSGTRKGNLDLYVDASGTQMKQVRFKYRNPQRPTTFGTAYPLSSYNDDNLEVSLSFDNGKAFGQRLNLTIAPSWLPYHINFDNNAPQAVVRFTGNSFSTVDQNNTPEGTDMAIDELYVVYVNDCSTAGTLQGGAAKLRETNTFPGTDFNFCHFPPYAIYVDRVNAATQVTDETHYGFEYQWQVSEDGGATYSDMAGETNQNLFLTSARVGKFRRKMTCTATGNSATSVEVETFFTNPVVYATLPYRQGFESWQTGCAALPTSSNDRPDQHWKNTPFNGQTSWRKNDEGRLANWLFNFPEGLPKPVSGVGAATFHTVFVNGVTGVNAPQPPLGALDLYVNCAVPGTKQLRFWYNNPDIANSITGNGNNDKLEVLYSIDGGANFSSLGELTRQDGWQEYTYTFESTSGSTVIRFLGYWSPDDSDIGIDEVKVDALVPCAGMPDGGKAQKSTTSGNACTTLSLVLYVEPTNANVVSAGLTYQWESSLTGAPSSWAPITGATEATYVAAPLTTTYYRRVATCVASGLSDPSDSTIYFIASSPEYATMPFKEDFERWSDACDTKDVPIPASNKIHWRTRPFTGDNAWRRTGEEGTGAWRDVNEPGWLQGGRVIPALGVGAASFHSYSATNRTTGDLDLFLNTVTATDDVKLLQFDYSNPDYPANVPGFTNQDFLEVYLSIDGGFSFGATPIAVYDRTKELWETKRIVFDNVEQPYLNAQYVVVRFRANSDNGGTDIGIDNLSMGVMPKKDAGVTAIEFNRCSPVFGRVVIEVSNFGSETIQNFPVEYTIGGNTYTDIFPIRLDRFQKAKFEFATPFNVSAVTSVNITAKTNLTGDAVPTNDSKTVTLNVSNFAGIPASGVFEEKFDSGIPANWRVEGKLNTPSWFSAKPNDLLPANVPADADEFPFNPFQLSVFDGNGNGFSGRFVALDDNKGGAARTFDADRLISPPFDLTNHTNIQLSFGSFNSNLIAGGQGDLFVEYSLDNGQSWTQIDRILGDGGGGPAQIIKTYTSLGVLAGKPSVRFAFKYNDKGVISGGAAIDNFRLAGQLVANPIARIEVPTVSRNFVNRGTDAHVVYRFVVEAKDADVVLSDVILKTSNQEYKIEDFKPNSFRLFASTDDILSANDRNLATLPVVGENKEIQMGCINYGIPRTQKHHFFFTVDVANDATVPDSISVSLPTISQNLFTVLGIRDSLGIAPQRGGYQIIVNPNTPPTSEKIVFEMKMKTVVGDPNLAFKPEDFKFKDVDAPVLELNKLNKLRISTINTRTGAKFQLNGTDITTNQEIAVGDISKMLFIPRLNDAGLNYTTFTFKVFDGRDWSTNDYTAVINVINDKIFIPTLFSPNGDGANDYFMVRGGEGSIDKISFKIVDRNNNPMYDSSNLTEITTIGWDGKKDGKEQPAGAYMWYIEGTYKDGKPLEFNGKKTGVIRLVR